MTNRLTLDESYVPASMFDSMCPKCKGFQHGARVTPYTTKGVIHYVPEWWIEKMLHGLGSKSRLETYNSACTGWVETCELMLMENIP